MSKSKKQEALLNNASCDNYSNYQLDAILPALMRVIKASDLKISAISFRYLISVINKKESKKRSGNKD